MRRISLAVALIGAVAATGCGSGSSRSSDGGNRGIAEGTFKVTVQDGQDGNAALEIKGGRVVSTPAGIDCGVGSTGACSFDFPIDADADGVADPVTLTATASGEDLSSVPYRPYQFLGFAGDCAGFTCSLSAGEGAADKYVLASFGGAPTAHPNFTVGMDPALHKEAAASGRLNCSKCHGTTLEGVGMAVNCRGCHTTDAIRAPGSTDFVPGAVTAPAGGVAGVVYSKRGAVAGASVYLVPTGDILADSIYAPPEYDAAVAYAAGALVTAHESVYRAIGAVAAGPNGPVAIGASDANWQFVALAHTPHALSSRNSYKVGDLALFANKQPSAWAAARAYLTGQEVAVGSTFPKGVYRCTVAGTSGATAPSGTTGDITDGTVTWNYVGSLASATVDVNGAALNTVFAVYEAERDQKGSAEGSTYYWSTFTTTVAIDPPGDALSDSPAWLRVGAADQLSYFDNLPQYVAKTYRAGALVRNGGNAYRALNAGNFPTSDAANWQNLGALKALAIASNVDEPLEGTIRQHGYAPVVTAADGSFVFPVPPASWTGKYYLTVVPADADHLPGGDVCRTPITVPAGGLVQNVRIATKPSAAATYVGQTACLNCHPNQHNAKGTLHNLGISRLVVDAPTGRPFYGENQDYSKFPEWYRALDEFEAAGGTRLCATYGTSYKYRRGACSGLSNAKFELLLSNEQLNGRKYYTITLTNVAGATPFPGSNINGTARTDGKYYIEFSYGGGLYKQRYLTRIGNQRFTMPLQYNFEGSSNEGLPGGRLVWQDYTNGDWYNTTTNAPVAQPAYRSFDSMCAGCHFTGYTLDPVANRAIGVKDVGGESDYDGDGALDTLNATCETCHGPGSEHAQPDGLTAGIVNPKLLTPEREVAICSGCHTRFVGNGGVLNGAALATEASLDATHRMPRPGISRKEFLANHISKVDDGVWDAVKGNGKYPVKHHQQASDFLGTEKHRNRGIPKGGYSVVAGMEGLNTCSDCHDLHGDTDAPRQLIKALDVRTAAGTSAGLCTTCHAKNLGGTGHTDRGSAAPFTAGRPNHSDPATIGWTCASCHVPKTAKSGSGAVAGNLGGEGFYRGDISSHLFIGVPYVYYAAPAKLPTDAKTVAADSAGNVDIMPTPMTSACGTCHTAPRANWKNGFQ